MDLAVVFKGHRPLMLDSSSIDSAISSIALVQGLIPEYRDKVFAIYPVIEYEGIQNWVDFTEPLYFSE